MASMDCPSAALPRLVPVPSPATLFEAIAGLRSILIRSPPIVDLLTLNVAVESQDTEYGEEDPAQLDEFEYSYSRDWLAQVVSIGTRCLTRGDDGGEAWEQVVDGAAALLADLSGPNAQGATTRTYILPSRPDQARAGLPAPIPQKATLAAAVLAYPTPPPTRPPSTAPRSISPAKPLDFRSSLVLRDATQLEASTGHRTWVAATLLARLIVNQPDSFFPPTSNPLRVLELGSGTGLVGLSAARTLASSGRNAQVVVSDGGDEPEAVLDNLRYNVAENFGNDQGGDAVSVRVQEVDWRDFVLSPTQAANPPSNASAPYSAHRYDIILGSDLAYERGQATLLHAAVAAHLAFPEEIPPTTSSGTLHTSTPPAFHLALPLRPTHKVEMEEIESCFPQVGPATPEYVLEPARVRYSRGGCRYRLVTVARREIVAPDGFESSQGRRLTRPGAGEMTYELRRIEWVADPSV